MSNGKIPSVVMKTPVEIWQEIVDQLLFNPMLFSLDPLYPGCNFHTALNEWFDTKRMRTLEIQRGILRLVSRSWKAIADASRWRYFESDPCHGEAPLPPRYQGARRLLLWHCCPVPWHIVNPDDDTRCPCYDSIGCIQAENLASLIGGCRSLCRILEFPLWHPTAASIRTFCDFKKSCLPNLDTLVIRISGPPDPLFPNMFSKLTILDVRVDFAPLTTKLLDITLPSVRILRITVLEDWECDFTEKWELPDLVYLDLNYPYLPSRLLSFLKRVGTGLLALRLLVRYEQIGLPNNFWQAVPRLEYLGLSQCNYLPPSPPVNHPLHTLAVWELEEDINNARNDAKEIMVTFKTIKTIADLHDWSDMPEEFSSYTVPMEHDHDLKSCWMCVAALNTACSNRGLRYEDGNGRTYAEFRNAAA